jgi:hypothetical protein
MTYNEDLQVVEAVCEWPGHDFESHRPAGSLREGIETLEGQEGWVMLDCNKWICPICASAGQGIQPIQEYKGEVQ